MRAARHAELRAHEEDSEDLGDTGDPTGLDLVDVDGEGLEELLEDDMVVRVLGRGDADAVRGERDADGSMAEDIIARGKLFDEPAG